MRLTKFKESRTLQLAAAAVTTLLFSSAVKAQLNITYTDGQVDNTAYSTTGGNNPLTFTVASGSATLNGALSGSGAVFKAGAGTLTITGVNTGLTGGITVSGGMLVSGGATTLGPSGSTLTVQSGATFDVNRSTNINYTLKIAGTGTAGQGALVNNGTSQDLNQVNNPNITLTASATVGGSADIAQVASAHTANTLNLGGFTMTKIGTNTWWFDNTTVTAGTINLNSGNIAVWNASNAAAASINVADTAGVSINLNGKSLSVGALSGGGNTGGNITLGSGTLTMGNAANSTFAGVISGTGGITKAGAGTQTLTNANTYTGVTTITGGTLKVGVATVANVSGAIGVNSAVALSNTAGAVLDLAGFDTQIGSLSGGGTTGGNVTLGAATLTIGANNSSATPYAGIISGTGSLVKIGTGKLTLTGSNTYTGTTTVSGGTLQLGKTTALSALSSISINSGATLAINAGGTGEFTGATSGAGSLGGLLSGIGGQAGSTVGLASGATLAIDTSNIAAGLTYAGNITTTGLGITKLGGTKLTLSGNNSYSGPTTVSVGTLAFAQPNAMSGSSAVTVASSATLAVNAGGAGEFTNATSGNGSIGGLLNGIGGQSGSTVSFTSGAILGIDTSNAPGSALSYTGDIAVTGVRITKLGTGKLTLSGTNSYTGSTTISTGILAFAQPASMPATGSVTTSAGAVLAVNVGGPGEFTNATSGNGSIGGLNSLLGGQAGGTLSMGTGSAFGLDTTNAPGGALTYAGTLTRSGVGLNKLGTGTLTLTGANIYTGITTLTEGTLSVATIGDGGISGNLGRATNAASNIVFNGGTLQYTGATASSNRAFTINPDKTAKIDVTTNALTISGVVAATNGALSKIGNGTLILSGANLYTGGTTITGGTLLANNTTGSATGTGDITVNSTGTFGGTGTVAGAVTVNTGGTLSPGASIATLKTGAISLTASDSSLLAEINAATPAADLLSVTGTVSLGGSTLNLSVANIASITTSATFELVANDSTDAVIGTFGSILGVPSGYTATVDYAFTGTDALGRVGTGNDIAVTISVPEPASLGVTVLSLGMLLGKRKNKSSKK